jgi:hypothetical protein
MAIEIISTKWSPVKMYMLMEYLRKSEKIGLVLVRALPGWLSFRNFGMPSVIGRVTFRGYKHATSLLLNCTNLTVSGPAPKFSKRTILPGPESSPEWVLIFSHLHPCETVSQLPEPVLNKPEKTVGRRSLRPDDPPNKKSFLLIQQPTYGTDSALVQRSGQTGAKLRVESNIFSHKIQNLLYLFLNSALTSSK